MAGKRNILDALGRLATAEDQFLTARFLAPVIRGRKVDVRIAGVRCQLRVEPEDFEGWGLFRPMSHLAARLQRPAQMGERSRYLELFPALSAVLCRREAQNWFALPPAADSRFQIEGLIAVQLAEEVDLFDSVRLRFDGSSFWFDALDPRADPGAAAFLRQSLSSMIEPDLLERPGLTGQQAAAYAIAYHERLRREMAGRQRQAEHRLREALSHAGAELHDFSERGDIYRVRYELDGSRHTSIVRKDDLTIQSAGICLSGEDDKFDLHSLVGVLREGEREGMLRRFGVEE